MRIVGPKIWDRLPPHIKNAENLSAFKQLIKTWDGVSRECNLCKKNLNTCIAPDTAKVKVFSLEGLYMYNVILLVGFD